MRQRFLAGAAALAFLSTHAARAADAPAPATPPPASPPAQQNSAVSFLTPAEQEQYAQARAKALAHNPQLEAEGKALIQEGTTVMSTGGPADRQGFLEKMTAHRQKLRAAMLKEDATLGPIFAQIDAHLSELRAKQFGTVQNSAASTAMTNAAPAQP